MNIWVIGRSYPTKQNKMRGSFEVEQAQLLAAHGHRVVYLASVLHPFNKVRKWGFDHFQEGGIDIYTHCVPFAPERMHLHSRMLLRMMWKKLLSEAEKAHGVPDVIHIHYPGMSGLPEAVLRYQERGAKIVLTDHWSKTLLNTMDGFQRRQLNEYVRSADELLCVSAPLKEAMRKVTGTQKEIKVVPNIVSSAFRISEKRRSDGKFHFIFIGRLAPSKQIDQLVQAFIEAFAGQEDVDLTVVGGGNERAKLEKIIAENKMETQVRLMGTLTRVETAQQLVQADALVSYSALETFGVPVIEAWACGKPVVITDSISFLDSWDDALGLQVAQGDIRAFSKAMAQMRLNGEKYDAQYLARFAKENFGEEAVYQKLMAVYAEG